MKRPFVGAYWPARKESHTESVSRLLKLLECLSAKHPSLQNWYQLAGSRKKAKSHPIEITFSSLEKLLEGHKTDIGNRPMLEAGFNFSAWNGDFDCSIGLSFHCGAYSEFVGNSVVLKFDDQDTHDGFPDRELLQSIHQLFIQELNPDHAVVLNSDDMTLGKKPWEDEKAWVKYSK